MQARVGCADGRPGRPSLTLARCARNALKEGSRLPRSKGYKKQEALDGGYLNVRLSADLSAKLDRDCADYARRAGKPDASRVRGSYVRELISAGAARVTGYGLEHRHR